MIYKRNIFLELHISQAKREGRIGKPLPKSEIVNNYELMLDLGQGNEAKGKARFNQLIKRNFYWMQDLEDIEFYVLHLYGYVKSNPRSKDKKLIVKDEKGRFEYVLCLLPNNESMQHMRDKEFIASLNYDVSQTEYLIPETQFRIDVMFDYHRKKIGVEVQKSLLEQLRLKQKIILLNNHFDVWYFIVPKKYVEKFSYLETSKGKVITMNEAIKEIKQILSQKPEFFEEDE